MHLYRPHEVLLDTLPNIPPNYSLRHSHPSTIAFSAQRASPELCSLAHTVNKLVRKLMYVHSTKVHIPPTTLNPFDLHKYHQDVVVAPALCVLSQLQRDQSKSGLHSSIETPAEGTSVIKVEYDSEELDVKQKLPITLFLPQGSINLSDRSAYVRSALASYFHDIRKEHPYSHIICSDLSSLIVLQPKSSAVGEGAQIVFESLSLDSSRSALRVVIAAYVLAALPDEFMSGPFRTGRTTPLGCVPSPHIEMEPDEKVFQTHRRHADFDFFALTQNESRARQFLRWKEHAYITAPEPLAPGARLVARTDAYPKHGPQLKPCSAVDDLHSQTRDHIRVVQRNDLLRSTVQLSTSCSFVLEILSNLTLSEPPASQRDCAVYKCHLVSVDGHDIPCAVDLCVKLFDDRQAFIPSRQWMKLFWTTSEESVQHEHASYTRLALLQGSLLPWYYGAHEFALPDGRVLYGILMEYIDAPSLDKLGADAFGDNEQIQLIKSIRHIISALQWADVSQLDWHSEQLLCPRRPGQGHYAVLIDLERTAMLIDPDEYYGQDDLSVCYAMFDSEPDVGLRSELVDAHFCWREDWDPRPILGIRRYVEPPNPYRELFSEINLEVGS